MIFGSIGPHDPYALHISPNVAGPTHDPYTSLTGKVASSLTINPAERTAVVLVIGQSTASNENGALHTPTNTTKVDNLNVYNGLMYQGKDPWLGCAGEIGSWLGRFADKAINAGMFARVIIEPVGIGGEPPRAWNRTGMYHHRAMIGLKRLKNLLGPSPSANTFPMVFWMLQGDVDATGDGYVTTYANYVDDFGQVHSLMAGLGINWPWYVSLTTRAMDVTQPTHRQAQTDVCNGTTIRQGPDTDTIPTGADRPDGIHFSASGCDLVAQKWLDAIDPYY